MKTTDYLTNVTPPVPPPGTPRAFVDGLAAGGGFRVPCVMVSPWTAGGWVCSETFDHTSVLRFLEAFTRPAQRTNRMFKS